MQRLRRLRPTPAAAVLLALALLWAQALGLLHRVQHAPLAAGTAVVVAADGSDDGLYGHERKSESCKLYDQLALGDGAVAAAPAASLPPVMPVPASAATVAQAKADRHDYRARAPPLTTIA